MRTHGPGHTSSADETLAALAGAAIPAAGAFTARAVATAMSSYTGSGTGTLTAVSGSIGTQDGVAMVTGDTLFIPEGLSNVSAVDAGPWYIQNAGSAMVSFVLIRPSWWLHGATMPTAGTVKIGPEGTFWPGTDWKSFAPKGSVVDTTDPAFFPGRVTQQNHARGRVQDRQQRAHSPGVWKQPVQLLFHEVLVDPRDVDDHVRGFCGQRRLPRLRCGRSLRGDVHRHRRGDRRLDRQPHDRELVASGRSTTGTMLEAGAPRKAG